MSNIENLFKHNTFFKLVSSEERPFNKQENKKVWKLIYESNEIHNRQVDEKLINYIKPFLYYLASKNINREGEGCRFQATYEVEVCWKNMYYDDGYYYQGTTPWMVMIGGKDELTMKVISHEHNYEGKTPFEIELIIYQSYYLPTISIKKAFKEDKCVICLTNPPNVLYCDCGHQVLCVECSKMVETLEKCPVCKTENTILRIIK